MSLTVIDNNNIFQKEVIGNVRTAQEDSHDIAVLTPNGDVFVVCDGMGGHVGGKQASSIAVKSIIDYLKKERYAQPMQALNDALQFANMQILGYANEHSELRGMGTTACILLLQDSEAYIAHVGDSRIYLYLENEKKLHRLTKDHSFVQALVDAGEITEEEAERHPNKNRILKALGIKPDLVPSFNMVKPKNDDVFLICSDGLSGMISDTTIENVMAQRKSISEKGETLIDLALKAGGFDNITLELIRISDSPHSKSVLKKSKQSSKNIKRKSGAKTLNILIAVIICAAIGYSVCEIGAYINKTQEKKCLNEKIENLTNNEKTIKSKIGAARESKEKVAIEIEQAKKDGLGNGLIAKFNHQVDSLEKEIANLDKELDTVKAKIQCMEDSLKKL